MAFFHWLVGVVAVESIASAGANSGVVSAVDVLLLAGEEAGEVVVERSHGASGRERAARFEGDLWWPSNGCDVLPSVYTEQQSKLQ